MPAIYESDYSGYIFARDVPAQLVPNETQKITLIVAACYFVAILILWHAPGLRWIIYPFKLLVVGMHEFSHAIVGVLTCARIHRIELDPDEGGATSMSGGIQCLTLPAGYLGSSLIGAALIACGFDTNASKVASLVVSVIFLLTLWWARRVWFEWLLIIFTIGLFVMFWFVAETIALRFFILFFGVMSCMYVVWDVIGELRSLPVSDQPPISSTDDTVARKSNQSDAGAFEEICGCCPSQVWGLLWTLIAIGFFAGGILVGLVAFKNDFEQQRLESEQFLSVPHSAGTSLTVSHCYFSTAIALAYFLLN